jgi:exodeoxyribonuclease VII large subunit
MNAQKPQAHYLTVSEVIQLLQSVLDQNVQQLTFVAEISELTRAASGHVYLTLKDEKSQISAVIWKGTVKSLSFVPASGMSVHCIAKPTIYAANGRLQVVIAHMTPAGEGLLQKRFLELKAKLEKEGLFNKERKRELPFLPRAIGIVTSKTGAVIHDMQVKFKERMPQIPLYLIDVRVQGEGASLEIAAAVEYLSQSNKVDLIIVARGGGSLEDLWAFNEEVVVRAIFASQVPVISGVGHEVDYTLTDYVADVRAPTPTAAAEMAVPNRVELLRRIDQLDARIRNTDRWFQSLVQKHDELQLSFDRRMIARFENYRMIIAAKSAHLERIRPNLLIERHQSRLALSAQRFTTALLRQIELRKSRLSNNRARFDGLSPTKVLERGYAIVESQGKIVRDVRELTPDQNIDVRVQRGALRAKVIELKLE